MSRTRLRIDHIDKMPPKVFPGVVCAKLDAGTVTATCFKLIDGEGQALALLTTTDQGKPGLAIFDPGGERPRAELMVDADGPQLRLNNKQGLARLTLKVNDRGDPVIWLTDPEGGPGMAVFLDRGRPHIVMFPRGATKTKQTLEVRSRTNVHSLSSWQLRKPASSTASSNFSRLSSEAYARRSISGGCRACWRGGSDGDAVVDAGDWYP